MVSEMSNTTKRILAAIILLSILLFVFFLGQNAFIFFLILIGFFLIDEAVINIFKCKRQSVTYFFNIFFYLLSINIVLYFYYVPYNLFYIEHLNSDFWWRALKSNFLLESILYRFVMTAIIVNFLALIYLFFEPIGDLFAINWLKKIKIFWGFYFFLNIVLFIFLVILAREIWIHSLVLLFILCFGTDTGAWFFGKRFGKNKLWPSVSPNKTIEGLIGGVFLSGVLATIYYVCFFEFTTLIIVTLFPLLGAVSHLGDLFQSKIKRQCGVKNSSSLIPGHGGVYDRLDSVLFLTPFYLVVMFYHSIF